MRRGVRICLILGLALLVGGPLLGLLGTVLGMVGSFHKVSAQGDAASPADLAGEIQLALLSTAVGIPVGAAGLALVIVALVLHFTRPPRDRQDGGP